MFVITGIWLRGGENEVILLVERGGEWYELFTEHMPLQGNEGNVWPISHIAEESLIYGK